MKKIKHLNLLFLAALVLSSFLVLGQEKIYNLNTIDELLTANTKNIKRSETCWSNAGASFLEAEWLRTGKKAVDISMMDFAHNMYLKKAAVVLDSDPKLRIDATGIAYDAIVLTGEYGMAPESAYMYPENDMLGSREKEGEMDAIIRGTLEMVKKTGEGFTERWENIFNTSLMSYLGETKIAFDYEGKNFSPVSFAEFAGLQMSDYVLLTSDSQTDMNILTDLDIAQNWANHKFYNVEIDNLVNGIKNNIKNGYTVLWYGAVNNDFIYYDENIALVPVAEMPGAEPAGDADAESDGTNFEPVPEKDITANLRKAAMELNLVGEQEYVLIYGLSTDKNGTEYFKAKYVCGEGNNVLNLSASFVKLNTVFVMMNKNGLPAKLRGGLGI